jgi:rhamnose utilization protein RhaD (predicted bifunctional aldolase and dehydrogenase)
MDDTELSEWVNSAYDAARKAYERMLDMINETEKTIAEEVIK